MQNQLNGCVISDDEIESLARKHIAENYEALEQMGAVSIPYRKTGQFKGIKSMIIEVLELANDRHKN